MSKAQTFSERRHSNAMPRTTWCHIRTTGTLLTRIVMSNHTSVLVHPSYQSKRNSFAVSRNSETGGHLGPRNLDQKRKVSLFPTCHTQREWETKTRFSQHLTANFHRPNASSHHMLFGCTNARKTSILQKVCDTIDSLVIQRRKGDGKK